MPENEGPLARYLVTGRRAAIYRRSAGFLAMAGALCLAETAWAGFSPINPPPSNEVSQTAIFNHVYGGSFNFSGANGMDLSNGTITAIRVSDFLPNTSDGAVNPGPNATDQVWTGMPHFADAKAVFAGESQAFGYVDGASGGSFHNLFNAVGTETFNVTGSTTFPGGISSSFRWATQTALGNDTSLPSDNFDGKDHMVSYEVHGLSGPYTTYLLFFEDNGNNFNPDFDYQDLVVQLQTTPANSTPEPGSLMLGAAAGLLLLKRFRHC